MNLFMEMMKEWEDDSNSEMFKYGVRELERTPQTCKITKRRLEVESGVANDHTPTLKYAI